MATVGDAMMAQPAGSTANPYDKSSALLGQAGDVYGGIATGNPIYESMNAYLNPYYDSVIADTKAGMMDQRNLDLNRVGDQAVAAGAFGGSRHGLVEGDVYESSARNMSEMENQMRMQQFQQAAGLGAQDVGFNLAGAGGLTGLGNQFYNIGNDITDRQMGQGTMQQQLLQSILGGASGQFDQFTNSPQNALTLLQAALSNDPRRGEGTATSTPGLYDYLGLGAQMGGSYLTGKA